MNWFELDFRSVPIQIQTGILLHLYDSAISFIYSSPGNALNNHNPMSFSTSPASTSSSSSSSSPRNVHPASQVDPATHSQALIDLLELDISREVIGTHSYTVQYIYKVSLAFFRIRCGFCRRDSRLCHGSETGFSFFPREDRYPST